MSLFRPAGSQWRTPQFKKQLIVSDFRGQLRVQSWPRKRGIPKTDAERDRLLIFRAWQMLIKTLIWKETEHEREAIRQYNRANRGQRGSAAIRFRDWQTQRLYGRGVGVRVQGGPTFYPVAIKRDASNILDWCTYTPGHLLLRGDDTWGQQTAGLPGQVLTAGSTGSPCTWQTPTA